jgi:hypothetical protein
MPGTGMSAASSLSGLNDLETDEANDGQAVDRLPELLAKPPLAF